MTDGLPLLVARDAGSRRCEWKPWCGLLSRWSIEATDRLPAPRTMAQIEGAQPWSPPSRYVCDNHLLGALNDVLAHPLCADADAAGPYPSSAIPSDGA